jgi:hypothetical protein
VTIGEHAIMMAIDQQQKQTAIENNNDKKTPFNSTIPAGQMVS